MTPERVIIRVGTSVLTRDLVWCECGRGISRNGFWNFCPKCGCEIDQDSYRAACGVAIANAATTYLGPEQQLEIAREELTAANETIGQLRKALNTPEIRDFAKGVISEAQHQRERWGSDHDAGKQPEDWFWLLGYLGGKCLAAQKAGDHEKALHHTISTAAVLANWHASMLGKTTMRPGIDPVERGIEKALADTPPSTASESDDLPIIAEMSGLLSGEQCQSILDSVAPPEPKADAVCGTCGTVHPNDGFTGWLYGGNYKERGRPLAERGTHSREPWFESSNGDHHSGFDVTFRPDCQPLKRK